MLAPLREARAFSTKCKPVVLPELFCNSQRIDFMLQLKRLSRRLAWNSSLQTRRRGPEYGLRTAGPKSPNGAEGRESGPENPNGDFTKRTQFLQCTKSRKWLARNTQQELEHRKALSDRRPQ